MDGRDGGKQMWKVGWIGWKKADVEGWMDGMEESRCGRLDGWDGGKQMWKVGWMGWRKADVDEWMGWRKADVD